jgi:hypothetical protein
MKLFKYLQFPVFSLALILLIYGFLSINKIKSDISVLKDDNFKLQSKIALLENNESVGRTKIASLENQLSKVGQPSSQKIITTTSTSTPVVTSDSVIKTIVQTNYKNQVDLTIQNVGSYKVDILDNDNAFTVLRRAAQNNNFALNFDTYSFGVFVKNIGGITPKQNEFWAFYYNAKFSNVGAGDQKVANGDSIFWQLQSF